MINGIRLYDKEITLLFNIFMFFFISLICVFLLPIFAAKRGWGFLSNQSQEPDPDSLSMISFKENVNSSKIKPII